MTIKIVKGRAAPDRYSTGRPSKYPFAEMKIGDSFDVEVRKNEKIDKVLTRVRSSAASYRQRNAKGKLSFIVRANDEKPNTVTVWSVAPLKAGNAGTKKSAK